MKFDNKTIYYDYHTKNKSFLKVCKILKDEGITNFAFPLMIYDKDLIGIDPYSEEVKNNLSLQLKIANEVANNVWYFIREVVRVPNPGASIPFGLHRGNLAMIFCLNCNLNTYVELPRQHYKTYSAVVYYAWVNMYKARNYNMIFTHKAYADTVENLRRLKQLLDPENGCLPEYLLAPLGKNDKNNENEFIIASNNNRIKVVGPANDTAGADKSGRGSTVPLIWLDEIAFLKYNWIMMGAMIPAFSTASQAAKENGTPYSILLTTTPSSLDIEEGKFVHNTLIDQAMNFDEKMYDYYFEKGLSWLQDYVEKSSLNYFVVVKFSYKQLGKSDKWLQEQLRKMNNDMTLVKRELLLEWTYSSDNSLLDEETLSNIAQFADVDYVSKMLIKDRYTLYFIRQPSNIFKKNYVISLDIAGGLGRDKTAITVIDPKDNLPTAIMYSNTMTVVDLVDVSCELLDKYFPMGIIVPELNYSGHTYVELMLKKGKYNSNLFYTIKESKAERIVQEDRDIMAKAKKKFVKKEKRVYGINTTVATRKIMVEDILFNLINNKPESFNNRDIFKELKTLERKKTGKIEHSDSGHDDILMSYLIGLFAILFEQKSMKRFLTNIYDDEDIFDVPEEELEARKNKAARIGKINSQIQRSNSTGLTRLLEEEGFFNHDAKTIEDEIIESKKAKKSKSGSINRFRNLFN